MNHLHLLFQLLNLLMKIFGMVSLHIRCPGYGSRRDTLPVLRIGEQPAAVPGIGVHADFAPAACEPAAYVRFYQETEEKHHEE